MKNKAIPLILACLLFLGSLACRISGELSQPAAGAPAVVRGSGKLAEETRPVSGFHAVNLATIGELEIEFGEEEALRLKAEDNLLPHFKTTVVDGVLTIETTEATGIEPTRPVKFFLTVKELDSLEASSLGDIRVGTVETGSFTALLSSSGKVTLGTLKAAQANLAVSSLGTLELDRLEAGRLEVEISGSGDVEIGSGQVQDLEARLTSLGSLKAQGLDMPQSDHAGRLQAELSGSGSLELGNLYASTAVFILGSLGDARVESLHADSLEVQVDGSGSLQIVAGEVKEQRVTLTSLGNYQAAELDCARAEVTITGSGSADIRASEYLKAKLDSLGQLRYRGRPVVEQFVTGSGTIEQVAP